MLHQPPHTCRDSTSLWLAWPEGWPWAGGRRGKRERKKGEGEVSRAAGSDTAKTVSERNREGLV